MNNYPFFAHLGFKLSCGMFASIMSVYFSRSLELQIENNKILSDISKKLDTK